MDIEKLDSWYSLLRALPAVASLIVVSQFLGQNFLKWTSQRVAYPLAQFHLAGILGFNLVGLIAIATGWLPLPLRNILALGLCLIALGWALRQTNILRIHCNQLWILSRRRHLLFVIPVLFTLGPALAYPSGWDELVYHLELPHRWYEAHWFTVQLDLPYSALPSLLESIFTLTYPVESLIAPRLLIWIVWLHGLCLLRSACGQVCQNANATCLTVALVGSPAALFISANCYVESLIWANTAGLLLLMVTTIQPTHAEHAYRHSAMLAVLMGGAIAIKMTSIGLLCLPIIASLLPSEKIRISKLQSTIAILLAVVFASPFYLRTWLQIGNPVAPFYAQWFTSDPAWLECSRYHHDLAVSNFGIRGLPGFLVGPGAMAFAHELYDGSLGWQWLVLLLLLVVAVLRASSLEYRRRNFVRLGIVAALLFYGLWFLTSQQVRFAIPLAMTVFLVAGIGIETYREPVQRLWRVALILLSVVSIPWINFGYYLDSWFCVLKVRTPVDYIRDGVTDSYAELSLYLHQTMPSDAKIITLFEHRLVYLPDDVEIATPYFQVKYFRTPETQTPENLMAELREKGVSHVVLTTNPLGPDVSSNRIQDQQNWFRNIDQCIANGQLRVIWKSEFHAVAELVQNSNVKPSAKRAVSQTLPKPTMRVRSCRRHRSNENRDLEIGVSA